MIKRRFVSVCLVCVMAMSLGLSSQVLANSSLTPYSFYNMNESGVTSWTQKDTTNKVYVNPTYGPSMNYTVMGSKVGGTSNGSIESGTHLIHQGTLAGITNNVKEHNNKYARLFYSRSGSQAQVYSGGYWSPDNLGYTAVYG